MKILQFLAGVISYLKNIFKKVEYSGHDVARLQAFLLQDDNAAKLGWNVNDPNTWKNGDFGCIWKKKGCVKYLEQLKIAGRNLTGELDLSGCTNLTQLTCYDNQISALDVSDLTKLTKLCCCNNRISVLNVSNLVNLTELSCFDNQISGLDVARLTKLIILDCGNNRIPFLDVSNLINLEMLVCHDNQICTLNVSNLTNLALLDCRTNQLSVLDISNLINLRELYCFENQISILDFSKLTKLIELCCECNYFASKASLVGFVESSLIGDFTFDPQFFVVLNLHSLTLPPGSISQLSAMASPFGINLDIFWSCDDVAIATVSENGQVRAIANGTTRIRVKSVANPLIKDTCLVTVSDGATSYDTSGEGAAENLPSQEN
ncbi:MAG: hypothetical protein LBD80_06960 [Tannerella sp.]|jgi:hypothetical protein|nr:hypothetical protein [Tannerella sp.]